MSKNIQYKFIGAPRLTFDEKVNDQLTGDSFANFTAKMGLGTENLASKASYTLSNLISRNHVLLEAMYRQSWIVGQVIDTVAEDMTKEGIVIASKLPPDDIQTLQSKMTELAIWKSICSTIKWSRLYGGAIAVILTDGADYEKALDVSKIGKDAFKGLIVFDRWQVEPSFGDLIQELGPNMGLPKFYNVMSGMETMGGKKIHHSRCIRLEGIEMPYYQKKYDNLWGMSVVERMYDRLLAFDSATAGAAQLLYKAYLRVVQVDGLRAALAAGGKTEQAVIKQFQYIRLMQMIEGITLLDKNDTFSVHNYTFAGISDTLIQFGQQISGAVNIPLVRLFGQSPSGFSTGDTDLRNYYDNVHRDQENVLRLPLRTVLEVMSMSCLGKPLPKDFNYTFKSLWQMSETEKSQIAAADSQNINTQVQAGTVSKKIAMKELAQQSAITDRWTNIAADDIEKAEENIPEHTDFGLNKEEPVVASPNHKLSLEDLKKKLTEIVNPVIKESTEKDQAVKNPLPPTPEENELEALEKELKSFGAPSVSDLEDELRKLDEPSLEKLEADLKLLISGSKTIADLEEDLKQIGLTDGSIAGLELALKEIKLPAPPKKMSMMDKAIAAVKKIFKGK